MKYVKPFHMAGLISAIVLAGCSQSAPPRDYMSICLSETGAKGNYVKSSQSTGANGLATIIPAEGGDASGALLMNACNESRHKAAGTLPEARKAPSEPTMMSNGKLSMPEGYILSPEDKTIWPTLTLAQQKRALSFLKSGSTIQSSLLED